MGRGRPKKSLLEHVEDGSFRAREHEELLETSALLPSKALRTLQQRYQRAQRPETRRRIAIEFERAVAAADARELEDVDEERPLAEILDELGPPGSAERAINFFPRFLWHFKGPKAGEPFELDEWQKAFLREAFRRKGKPTVKASIAGRVVMLARRVYKRIVLMVPGGNGKTPLAAGLGLLAVLELDDAPEIYCIAGAKDQAARAQEYASAWVEGTEERPSELKRWLKVRGNRIVNRRTRGEMNVLASSGPLIEGKEPSVIIVDELHAFEHERQERSFSGLVGKLHKRPDSYALVISTAGRGEENILRRIVKAALRASQVVQRGFLTIARNEAGRNLLWMYAAPAEAPLEGAEGLKVIRAVNPASWIDPRDIAEQVAEEAGGEAEFRRLARNEWVGSRNQWLPTGAWEKRFDPKRLPPPRGTEIGLAFDGSYNNDSTGLVGCTRDKHVFVIGHWERPDDDPEWVVPRGEVKDAVDQAMRDYRVVSFYADPPGWYDEVEEWGREYEDVMVVEFFTNQVKIMAQACREFYADVVNPPAGGGVTHDGNPDLARHLANAYAKETPDGAYIVKEYRGSPNKIDLAVGAVLARFAAVRAQPRRRRRVVAWS